MPDAASNPGPKVQSRRWTILAAGFLLAALAMVVIYTNRGAFYSPIALVVAAAIGLAALLLQLRLRPSEAAPVRSPLWLNTVGIIFAIGAVAADFLHVNPALLMVAALMAVVCFSISGVVVLAALRRQRG